MAAPRITLDLGSTMGPSGKERAAAGKMLQEMDRMIEAERRRVREEIAAAQIPERSESVLWLDDILGRETVDRLISQGRLVPDPDGGKPTFKMKASEVGRLFGEAEYTEWAEIADRVLVGIEIPKPESLRKGFQRTPRL